MNTTRHTPLTTILWMMLLVSPAEQVHADEIKVEGTFGAWRVFSASDPMTDRNWFGASLTSGDQTRLQVECETGKPLSVAVISPRFLGNGVRDFLYRVDRTPAHEGVGNYQKNTALLWCNESCPNQPQPAVGQRFVGNIAEGSELLIRLFDLDRNTIDVRFGLRGAQEAIDRLSAICKPANESLPSASIPQQSAPAQPTVGSNSQPSPAKPNIDDSKTLEAALERLRSLQAQTQATRAYNPPRGGAPGGGSPNGVDNAKLSGADRGAIVDRIRECWTRDAGARGEAEMSATLQIITDGTGTVRDVKIVQSGQGPDGIAFGERVRRAALDPQCNPMPLPKALLRQSRTISLTFRP